MTFNTIIPTPTKIEIHKTEPFLLPQILEICFNDANIDHKDLLERIGNTLKILTDGAVGFSVQINQPKDKGKALILKMNNSVQKNEYIVDVDTEIRITAGNLQSLMQGIVSLFQLISFDSSTPVQWAVPQCHIEDSPSFPYIGLMIDVARKWHPLPDLKQCILLCWWYKIPYLHIHFTDNQSFTLPIRSFPKLASKLRHYSEQEIKDLNQFAQSYGVTIIPEIDLPGHSRSMIKAYPYLFGVQPFKFWRPQSNAINFGKEEVYQALETIIKEACAMFPHSPYFHLGADEVNFKELENDPDMKAYRTKINLPNNKELYRHFIVQMNKVVSACGKQMCVWEGFGPEGQVPIPKEIPVFVFESLYNTADRLIADGYQVVNTSWKPIYVTTRKNWTPEEIYQWTPYRWENWVERSLAYEKPIVISNTSLLLGAQMCSWEQPAEMEIPSLRHRVPTFIEKAWNPFNEIEFIEFQDKLSLQDKKFEKMLQLASDF
jgi:hexosaminidase